MWQTADTEDRFTFRGTLPEGAGMVNATDREAEVFSHWGKRLVPAGCGVLSTLRGPKIVCPGQVIYRRPDGTWDVEKSDV